MDVEQNLFYSSNIKSMRSYLEDIEYHLKNYTADPNWILNEIKKIKKKITELNLFFAKL